MGANDEGIDCSCVLACQYTPFSRPLCSNKNSMVQVIPNTYPILLLGRIMTGLGSGCVFISTSLYVAECAPRKLRGSFVGTVSSTPSSNCHILSIPYVQTPSFSPFSTSNLSHSQVTQFGYQLGTCLAFWTGYRMSFHHSPIQIGWRISNALQIPVGLTFILISFYYPESPRYFLENIQISPKRPSHN